MPGHFSPTKIHGWEVLHLMATMNTETTIKTVVAPAIMYATMPCFFSGDSRRKRKATEHLVNHSVMM